MIRVYLLPVVTIDGVERVVGIASLHDAVLCCTADPDVRKLIMDTTPSEHDTLMLYAIEVDSPTVDEVVCFDNHFEPYEPDPDTLRVEELLSTSPSVITQPEMWELVRLFGKRLGYRF